MSIRNLMIATGRKSKGLTKALRIINPVVNSNGIYDVTDDDGNTFPAFVLMTIDGGYWVLVARWTGFISSALPSAKISFEKSIQKNKPVSGYSNLAASMPAIPSGKISKNPSKEWLLINGNAGWQSNLGQWQKGQTLNEDVTHIVHGVGVPVTTPSGNRTLHGHRTGWFQDTHVSAGFGFWNQSGNMGPCGGAGREGTSKYCPVMAFSNEGYSVHSDSTSVKSLYIRATNYPIQ